MNILKLCIQHKKNFILIFYIILLLIIHLLFYFILNQFYSLNNYKKIIFKLHILIIPTIINGNVFTLLFI